MKLQWATAGAMVFSLGLSASRADDDFLFIIVDDQSEVRYGSSVRPNPTSAIDRLAAEATVFKQAYCPATVCNASRTSILTCRPPYLTGIFENKEDPRSLRTVLHYLKSEGYKLRASGKIFHTGFAQNSVFTTAADPRPKGGTKVELKKRGFGAPLRIGVDKAKANRDGAALKADRTIRSVRNANPNDKNGFLIGFTATHLPFFVPDSRRYSKAYPRRSIALPVETWSSQPEFAPDLNRKYRLSARKRKEVIARYNGCLRYVSDQAARVIRTFRNKFPDGHIVFTSDNGFLLDEGRSWGKPSTMEVASRVPYLVWSNQLPAGPVEGPVSIGTAFPLLLDLCGVAAYPDAHWKSPRESILRGRTPEGEIVYTYAGRREWVRATRGDTVVHFKDDKTYVTGLDDRPLD